MVDPVLDFLCVIRAGGDVQKGYAMDCCVCDFDCVCVRASVEVKWTQLQSDALWEPILLVFGL